MQLEEEGSDSPKSQRGNMARIKLEMLDSGGFSLIDHAWSRALVIHLESLMSSIGRAVAVWRCGCVAACQGDCATISCCFPSFIIGGRSDSTITMTCIHYSGEEKIHCVSGAIGDTRRRELLLAQDPHAR